MNDGLARLHSIDVAQAGLSDYGKPGSYYARQYQRWTDQYRASETAKIEDMERLIAWLADKVPADDGRVALVHGDWRIDNMIFDAGVAAPARGPRLGAVDARPSVRRPRLPVHAMAAAGRQVSRIGRRRPRGGAAYRPKPNMSPRIAGGWGSRTSPIGRSSSPSASSAASRSIRASINVRSTATPRIRSSPGQLGASVPLVACVAREGVEGRSDRSA